MKRKTKKQSSAPQKVKTVEAKTENQKDYIRAIIENDVIFSGLTTTGFEHMARVSEVIATADFNVKYDDLTDVLVENFHDQVSGASEGATLMGTDDTPSDGEFEFKFANSIITNAALSEGDVMAVDVSVKAVGAGRGSSDLLFEISC